MQKSSANNNVSAKTESKNDTHSKPSDTSNNSQMITRSNAGYFINFRVFVSPEFDIDPKTCDIGILSDYFNNWNNNSMQKLTFIRYIRKYMR